MSDNPFSGPFAGAPGIGGNPIDNEANAVVRCPGCKSQKFRAWTTDYGVMRKCHDCKQEWSGGTMGAARGILTGPRPGPGMPAPDDDIPGVQYTGAGFRDPSKTFGDDEW